MWDSFSILPPELDVVGVFGDKLKLSWISVIPQEHLRMRLIVNLSEKPYEGTPSVNNTTYSYFAPE